MSPEVWRPAPRLEGRYDVSSLGRVRSWIKTGPSSGVALAPRIVNGSIFSTGYRQLWTREGHRSVHRLVCEAFHGTPPSGLHVARHLDGDKLNNSASNLAWGTGSENMADSRRHGTDPLGSRNPAAKLDEATVAQIKGLLTDERGNRAALARQFGVSPSMVERIANGKNWVHVRPVLIREGVES